MVTVTISNVLYHVMAVSFAVCLTAGIFKIINDIDHKEG